MMIADKKVFICLKTERLFWRCVPKCWARKPMFCGIWFDSVRFTTVVRNIL